MYAIGKKYKTDKITQHYYHRYYEKYLNIYRKYNITLLEIGVDKNRSIKLWEEYFPQGKIFGLEKENSHHIGTEKTKIIQGDQSNAKDLQKLINETNDCDIIIDDGSHVPEHQLFTFNFLFEKCLKDGGVYIIEDVETSYWKKSKGATLYGYIIDAGYSKKNNIINIFSDVVHVVNRNFLNNDCKNYIFKKSKITKECLEKISSIEFGMNCVIIKKMSKFEYENISKREYRFKEFI